MEENVTASDDVYEFSDMEFRPMGDWHDGPIYIFILTTEGVIHFHGASMSREGTVNLARTMRFSPCESEQPRSH